MKYKTGDLIEDRRGRWTGDVGVVVDVFYDGHSHHYKIWWLSGKHAGKKSDEPTTEVDNGDNCHKLE